jgi:hypothetical protein
MVAVMIDSSSGEPYADSGGLQGNGYAVGDHAGFSPELTCRAGFARLWTGNIPHAPE